MVTTQRITKLESDELALVVIEPKDIQTVFTTPGAVDPILEKIAAEARSFVADASTPSGRKSIASIAFKVAKSKTYLDGLGKELVDGLKDLPKKVDANRKQIRDFLDALKDEVRQPLTAWEVEQERIEAERLEQERLAQVREQVNRDHEFALLMDADITRQREEARKAAEQAKKEHEERIAAEAAEKARLAAEAKAKAEQEAAIRRELEAKMATEAAEKRAKEAEEREARAKQEAAAREELAREQAIKAEQERVAAEERRAKEEQAKREANKKHRAKINTEIANDLRAIGFDEMTSTAIIEAIAQGKIRHTAITY